jgi:hypothetical protein
MSGGLQPTGGQMKAALRRPAKVAPRLALPWTVGALAALAARRLPTVAFAALRRAPAGESAGSWWSAAARSAAVLEAPTARSSRW